MRLNVPFPNGNFRSHLYIFQTGEFPVCRAHMTLPICFCQNEPSSLFQWNLLQVFLRHHRRQHRSRILSGPAPEYQGSHENTSSLQQYGISCPQFYGAQYIKAAPGRLRACPL